MKLKEQILKLRKKGFSYSKIAEKLNCSKSTVA
jgi:DNA-binding NarL/FixJ family response regulator